MTQPRTDRYLDASPTPVRDLVLRSSHAEFIALADAIEPNPAADAMFAAEISAMSDADLAERITDRPDLRAEVRALFARAEAAR